ncbi:MAG: hypothetical protein HWQ41_30220 [Nostoc sp. NOS(2021)]|nr:hypothetical protein [Nostoc sp. NOS(2021)]MBN3899390.1 hypothetical protein [Nostoc sp. NOS(2021)]
MAAGKGGQMILRDEFYKILLVIDNTADQEKNRTFVLITMRNGVRSLR